MRLAITIYDFVFMAAVVLKWVFRFFMIAVVCRACYFAENFQDGAIAVLSGVFLYLFVVTVLRNSCGGCQDEEDYSDLRNQDNIYTASLRDD
jgi:hypothetical protein